MKEENAGDGEMPENQNVENAGFEARQPEYRVVQPEYDTREGKTVFRDVGAIWKNVSQKTGKEFFTLKIGKLRLLVFENQKLQR
ncbi:MAG: hypothetical protein WC492_04770 [Candidatus Micrarchaeia archaeon]